MIDRILEISKKEGLSHIGSNLTAYDIIAEIYEKKRLEDKFVLSSGHAHLAHALVMGREDMPAGIHCDKENGCDVSTGSLGLGLPIALGMAIASKDRDVYCIISDGECSEGSVWESLRVAGELKLTNLKVYCNANGWGAYKQIDVDELDKRLNIFYPVKVVRTNSDFGEIKGQDAHYATVTTVK